MASARRAGAAVQVGESAADAAARQLVRICAHGEAPSPSLAALVHHVVPSTSAPDAIVDAAPWVGATTSERADALVDLLRLTDALPPARVPDLAFPRLTPLR
jgi:hypothetical protein